MKWSQRVKLLSLALCLVLIVTGTALAKSSNPRKIEIPPLDIQLPFQGTGGETTTDAVTHEPVVETTADAVYDEQPGGVVAQAVYSDLAIDSVVSTSLVPGEEARYVIAFSAPEALNLEEAAISLALPESFSIIQNDMLDADPGCTLSSLQYKNKDKDKYWSVLQGDAEVVNENGLTTFSLQVNTSASATVNAGRTIYLTLPGVVNASDEGTYPVQLLLQCGTDTHGAQTECSLGPAPAVAPENLDVEAVSSYTLEAQWDPVEGATRYQLFFALDPNGYFIQACDFGKDPNPGEMWNLTDTDCTFTAKGNGYLEAGRTYYFKVRAGNEYGFGPLSEMYKVETPALILDAPPMVGRSPIRVGISEDVEIVDPDRIMVFEKTTATPITAEVTADGDTITIVSDSLKTGTRYQVVFFEDALVSTGDIPTYNNLFGFEFVAINKGLK